MMNKIKKFVTACEEMKIGFGQWLIAGLAVVLLRTTIEPIVAGGGLPFIHPFYLVHVPLFFISLLLAVIVLLHFFTKTDIVKVSKLALIFFPVILLPVMIDFFFVLLTRTKVTYCYICYDVGLNFINFFNPFFSIPDFPLTLRLELAVISVLSFSYIFFKRHNVFISLVGAFFIFGACFFYVAIPGIFVNFCVFLTPLAFHAGRFFRGLLGFSSLNGPKVTKGLFVDENLMIAELIPTLLLVLIWYYRYDRKKWLALVKNFRWTRSVHYMLLAVIGLLLYFIHNPNRDYFTFLKITGILTAVFFAFQFSIVTNDIFDVACDEISNKNRPLIAKVMDRSEYLKIGFAYLLFALLFSFWIGDTCLLLTLLFIALYAVYSLPPFQLKRFFLTSSLIIGLQALVAFLLGQISLQPEGTLNVAYTPIWFLVFIVFFLSSPVKDLKDVEGDRRMDVYTLPVLLGEVKARKIIAWLVFVSYAFIPIVLRQSAVLHCPFILAPLSLIFGLVNFFYIRQPGSREKVIFLLYFSYAVLLLLFLR